MNRLVKNKLSSPLVSIGIDSSLTNVNVDVKDILPNPLAGIANTGMSMVPSTGQVMKMSIVVQNAGIVVEGITNVRFVSADAATATFQCVVPLKMTFNLSVQNISLMLCKLANLDIPTAELSITLQITMKLNKQNFSKVDVGIEVASIQSSLQAPINNWVDSQVAATAFPGCFRNADCNTSPCSWYDAPCKLAWPGVCRAQNAACDAKEAAWPITDCGLANALLKGSGAAIHGQIQSQIAYLIRVNATGPLRDGLVNSPEVVAFFNDFLKTGISRCNTTS